MAAKTLVAGMMIVLGMPAAIAGPASTGAPAAPGASYVWYDGNRERTVWMSPRHIAEFGSGSAPEGTHGAKSGGEEIRIWDLEPGKDLATVLANARSANAASRYSPVLQDGKSGGRLRALPGNVIVTLDAITEESAARDWADGAGLELLSRVNVGRNRWLVKSEEGMASLELANSLIGTPGVVTASPVWWQETATR